MSRLYTDSIFFGSKITSDGDCSHEIKRCLLLGRKAMTNLVTLVTQACLTLWDPMDCSPLGSSVHGLLQARIMEWIALSSSRGSSPPRGQTYISCVSCIGRWIFFYQLCHLGSPPILLGLYIKLIFKLLYVFDQNK